MITQREAKCLNLRIQGLVAKQIASELGISKSTVDVHFENALKRTGCTTSYQLVAKYVAGRVRIAKPKGMI